MSGFINKVKSNKTMMYFLVVSVMLLFCVTLNYTFSAFTASREHTVANITLGSLSYDTELNGSAGSIITATSNTVTKTNVTLLSNNSFATNYELTYDICTTSNCSSTVNSVTGLKVEYSSRTQDNVSGTVASSGSKVIRIIVTNPTNTTYYIRLGVNAGFSHNVLVKENKINKEYSEEDLVVNVFIDGDESDSFPDERAYTPSVSCHDPLGGSVSATPKLRWDKDNTQWLLSVSNINSTEIRCDVSFTPTAVNNCTDTAHATLTKGDQYVNGQYTYTYREKYIYTGDYNGDELLWEDTDEDGWSVILTDSLENDGESTTPVTTTLCTSINGKPIVSMSNMFWLSQATSIDLSSFDTSNVTDMSYMFTNVVADVDLSSFDTSYVTTMEGMFGGIGSNMLNISLLDTSNVTNMDSMFSYSLITTIDLSVFDTSNVLTMDRMFQYSSFSSLDLSSFDTSSVTTMLNMFYASSSTSIDLSSFDTSNVTDMGEMFGYTSVTTLDLSSFNTSNVTNMEYMFSGAAATTGYARTSTDANRFNNVAGSLSNGSNPNTDIPNTLTFTVR